MKTKKDIKVIIVNPELIENAKKKITRAAYRAYLESLRSSKKHKIM